LERKNNNKNKEMNDITATVLQTLLENPDKELDKEKQEDTLKTSLKIQSDPITLDDILNIFDGIEEHTGRIMIITSNHYEKLDKALTRPGRIDIKLEMSKLSINSIVEIYNHLYDKIIPRHAINKLPNCKCTPAEVMNMFLNNQYDEKQFLKQLCSHKIE
jgi:chaperone BCS1